MTVVVLTDCPPRLRGDLSKWLLEINTGVYVGNITSRVRSELWERICENVRHGHATMVYRAANEQKMDFLIHNALWEPVDYDGIKLIRRPSPERVRRKERGSQDLSGFSKAATYKKLGSIADARKRTRAAFYTVVDIETTGLDPMKDMIIEIAALRVENKEPTSQFHRMIKIGMPLSPSITALTGITDDELEGCGVPLEKAISDFVEFVGKDLLVSHHASFDQRFLLIACKDCKLPLLKNSFADTLVIARRKITGVPDYKLETLAKHFSLDADGCHRALRDCYITHGIYSKLNQIS